MSAAQSIGQLSVWVDAARPRTLTAAFAPVLVGAACAWQTGPFRFGAVLAALFGAIFIQIGTNFANDVFDFEKGADTDERLGPRRAVQAGLLDAKSVRCAMVVSFCVAAVFGLYLVVLSGPAILLLGLLSIAAGIGYTAGPYALGYLGLGDLFVMIFFGFVATCGTAFVASGSIPVMAWLAAIPVGALATAVLVVNNLRDRITDARARKRTLAVRYGRRAVIMEYALLLVLSYAVPFALLSLGLASAWVLLPLVTLPWALALGFRVARWDGRQLNAALGGTAQLLLAYSACLAVGIVLA